MIFCTKRYDKINDKWYCDHYIVAYSFQKAEMICKKNNLILDGILIEQIILDENNEIEKILPFIKEINDIILYERPSNQRTLDEKEKYQTPTVQIDHKF